jgi:Ca-activated chloride channel family protein
LVAVVSALGWTAPASRAQAAQFRSGTELVVLQVSVVDQQRRLISGLSQEDFAVFEEGRSQPVSLFASTTAPLDLMLLLDTSSSMYERLAATQEAAINFVRTLKAGDRGAVVLFNDSVRIAQALTGDSEALDTAIQGAATAGGTALYEALYVALRELSRARRGAEDPMRRQALVVLTDGDDTSSRLLFDDVLDEARRSAVTVFTIMPSAPAWETFFDTARRRPSAPYDMRQLAEETGGRSFAPARIEDLAGVYGEIAEELSRQYWLAYVPPPSSSGFRRVTVRVITQPALRARTRAGYYATTRASVPAPSAQRSAR